MKKKKFNIKSVNWGGIIGVALIIVLAFGTIAMFSSVEAKKTKDVSSSAFSVGGLDETTGLYKETDQSIYTKDLIRCEGLNIKRDFEAEGTYQVFFYKLNGDFSHATLSMDATQREFSYLTTPDIMYCRIVITPELGSDDKVHFYDVLKYASLYDITVNKEQSDKYEDAYCMLGDLSESSGTTLNDFQISTFVKGETATTVAAEGYTTYFTSINTTYHDGKSYGKVDIWIEKTAEIKDFNIDYILTFGDNTVYSGDSIEVNNFKGEWIVLTMTVPYTDELLKIKVSIPASTSVYVIEYND